MSFEDAIAWSRNVVAAKVALGLDKNAPGRVGDPLLDVDASSGSASRPGIDLAGEVRRDRPRPGDQRRGSRSTSPTGRSDRASR